MQFRCAVGQPEVVGIAPQGPVRQSGPGGSEVLERVISPAQEPTHISFFPESKFSLTLFFFRMSRELRGNPIVGNIFYTWFCENSVFSLFSEGKITKPRYHLSRKMISIGLFIIFHPPPPPPDPPTHSSRYPCILHVEWISLFGDQEAAATGISRLSNAVGLNSSAWGGGRNHEKGLRKAMRDRNSPRHSERAGAQSCGEGVGEQEKVLGTFWMCRWLDFGCSCLQHAMNFCER